MTTGITAVVGLLLLIASYFVDGGEAHHMRFWTNLLHNAAFFTGISFMACFAYAAFTTAYAGWFVQFKRVWESFGMFLLPALFIFGILIVGVWTHSTHLYHWNDAAAVEGDMVLYGKKAFLNPVWFTVATVLFLGLYYFMISSIRRISIDEDFNGTTDYSHHRRIKKWAAPFLAVIGFTSPFLIWQWIMSIDAHWYSTMFAWYASASLFVAMTALTIMLLIYLKSRGYFPTVNAEHFHDLGKYLFAISIFWTYVWFSQFMLIWYGNVGEETIYFRLRMDSYPVLFWANLALNFVAPFFILMRNDTKRKFGTLFFASAIVFFGHWVDFFSMIKPGAREAMIHMEHSEGHGAGHGEEAHLDMHGDDHGGDHAAAGHDDHGGDHAAMEGHDGPHESLADHAEGGSEVTNGHGASTDTYVAEDHSGNSDDHARGPNDAESPVPDANQFEGGNPVTDADGDVELVTDDGVGADIEHASLPYKAGFTLPGLLEIGIFLGFLGGYLFFVLSILTKAPLEPKRDPYYEESLHHHT